MYLTEPHYRVKWPFLFDHLINKMMRIFDLFCIGGIVEAQVRPWVDAAHALGSFTIVVGIEEFPFKMRREKRSECS